MFILVDMDKSSTKNFSSLNEVKAYVDGIVGNVGLPADATETIKKAIDLLIPVIKYKQQAEDLSTNRYFINPDEIKKEEEKKLPLGYVEVMKKEDLITKATSDTGEDDILGTETNEIKETTEVKPIICHLESDEFIKNCMKSNMKPTQLKKQGNFLLGSRWISPEDAGYNPELTKDIETIFTDSRIVVNSHDYEVAADHEGNAEEILDRFKDLEKLKNSKITPRMKDLENKLAKWMWENCLENRTNLGSLYIDGNVYWNLLLHSKGNKKILGTINVPEEILNILKDSELEGYAFTYRNTENTTYLSYVSEKRLKPGMFEEFVDLSTYIDSLNIKFQNARVLDVLYQCYVGHYEDSIRIKNLEEWILAFVNMRLKKENKESSVKSSVLYTTFLEWLEGLWCDEVCLETIELRRSIYAKLKAVCTQKTFSSILKSMAGLSSVRKADGIYWVGVALTDSAGSFAPFEAGETLEGYQSVSFAAVLEDTPVVKTEEQKVKEILNDPLKVSARRAMPSEAFGIKTSVPGKS